MQKCALITGITGQDGSYLAEHLLNLGYEVHGLKRRTSVPNIERIQHLIESKIYEGRFHLHSGDVIDYLYLSRLINELKPDEVYNLAGQSHVGVSFQIPDYTYQVNGNSVSNILETIAMNSSKQIKFYQASSSEIFGNIAVEGAIDEDSPKVPVSPYGVSKLFAHESVRMFRNTKNTYAVSGILFNHESPRRGEDFVSRKISMGLVRVKLGLSDSLTLGNLNSYRDWGHAKDYVQAMHLMMQSPSPSDFVIATGVTRSIKDFIHEVAKRLEIGLEWIGSGLNERAVDPSSGKIIINVDAKFFRTSELNYLCGNPSKARTILGWIPSFSFGDLVEDMIQSDLKLLSVVKKNKLV